MSNWDEKLSSEDLANGLDAVEELERLEDFIKTFDSYAKPGNFIQIPIAWPRLKNFLIICSGNIKISVRKCLQW